MLYIEPQLVEQVRAAAEPEDLYALVEEAVRLEHATIPPYLCAYFTLKPGANDVVAEIIRSVVIEEMLHMTIAANLLIAIGGAPAIDRPGFVPTYPGKLPMNVGNSVTVSLRKCSIPQVRDVFMQIEAPETPLEFELLSLAEPPATIAQFYAALLEKLEEMGPSAFKGDFSLEIVDKAGFGDLMFPITDLDSAKKAISIIVVQGEGTTTSPDDAEGQLAHYYRFRQIVEGRALVKDPAAPGGWSYSGPPLAIDPAGVRDMADDPRTSDYPPGSKARALVDTFNRSYSTLLRALHRTFNGEPDHLPAAVGLMYDVRLAALDVLAQPSPSGAGQCGLPFDYVEP